MITSNLTEDNIDAYVEQYIATDLYRAFGEDVSVKYGRAKFDMVSIEKDIRGEIKLRGPISPTTARNIVSNIIWSSMSCADQAYALRVTAQAYEPGGNFGFN